MSIPKYPRYELNLSPRQAKYGEVLFADALHFMPYKYRGMVEILRTCAAVVWSGEKHYFAQESAIREIRRVNFGFRKVELWATFTKPDSIFYPDKCLWYRIDRLSRETRLEYDRVLGKKKP